MRNEEMPIASREFKLKDNLSARLEYRCDVISERPVDGGWGGFTEEAFHEDVLLVLVDGKGNDIGECSMDSVFTGKDMPECFGVSREADIASVEFYGPERSRLQVMNSAYDAKALKEEAKKLAEEYRPEEARRMLRKRKDKCRAEEEDRAREILECKNVFPDKESMRQWMRQYNDLMNEGGYGYIPMAVTQDDVEWARDVLGMTESAPVAP